MDRKKLVTMKKLLLSILIAVTLVGLFAPAGKVQAQAVGSCVDPSGKTLPDKTFETCNPPNTWRVSTGQTSSTNLNLQEQVMCEQSPGPGIPPITTGPMFEGQCLALGGTPRPVTTPTNTLTAFEKAVNETKCLYLESGWIPSLNVMGCLLRITYATFFQLGAFLLYVAGYFFNVMVATTLSGDLLSLDFVSVSWGIVRDLANLFFIIILLYIAIRVILGMVGHGVKEMVAQVVIMALLINFSMFVTQVVIDTSNVLGLVFYNKIDTRKEVGGTLVGTAYSEASKRGEKDLSGGLVDAFNPTKLLDNSFFMSLQELKIESLLPAGLSGPDLRPPPSFLLAMTVIAGVIMLFAAYSLFVAGFSFLGRLIELFVLVVFSPFAFMSFSAPFLKKTEYIGWDDWFHRLLKTSFMAPIFLFFLYFIFKVVHANIFSSFLKPKQGPIIAILGILLPALLILVLLLRATKYAKKGAGEIGSSIVSLAKTGGALALGGTALGLAALGRGSIGATAKYVQNEGARKKDLKMTDLRRDLKSGWYKPWKYPSLAGKTVAGVGKAIPAGVATIIGKPARQYLQKQDKGYAEKTHSTHILDAKMQSEFGHQYGKDAKYKDLTEHEQGIVKGEVEKDEMAKFRYGKLFKDLEAPQAREIQMLHGAGNRAVADKDGKTIGYGTAVTYGNVRGANGVIDPGLQGKQFKSDFFVDMSKANATVGEFVQALRKGSFDIRNLPEMSAKSKGFPKMGVAIVAGVAAGVRLGMKKGAGIEHYGTPQRDVWKDLSNTISDSLKNMKINIGGDGHGGGDSHAKEVKSVGH